MLLPLIANSLNEEETGNPGAPGDVPVEAAFGSFTLGTTPWTVPLTKFANTTVNGFIVTFCEDVSGGATPLRMSVGFVGSSGIPEDQEFCYAWSDEHNVTTTAAQKRIRSGCCGMLLDPNTGVPDITISTQVIAPVAIRFEPRDADGNVKANDGLTYTIHVYAFGGSARFQIGHDATNSTLNGTKRVDVGSLPGAPKTVLLMANIGRFTTTWFNNFNGVTGDDTGALPHSDFAMGAATDDGAGGVTAQAGVAHRRTNGRILGGAVVTSPGAYVTDSANATERIIRYAKALGADPVPGGIEVTAMDEDGTGPYFELTTRDLGGSWEFGYVAIWTAAAEFAVKTIEMALSSGSDTDISLGINVEGMVALSSDVLWTWRHTYVTAAARAGAHGFVFTDGSDAQGGQQLTMSHQFRHNVTTTDVENNEAQTDLIDLPRHTGATGLVGSFGADGFTSDGFDYTTTAWVGTNSRAWVVWAIGSIQPVPDGIQISVDLGAIAPRFLVRPDGIGVVASLGAIDPHFIAIPTGLQVLAALGEIDPTIGAVPDGLQVVVELGARVANAVTAIAVTPDGIAAEVNLGAIDPDVQVTPTGLAVTVSLGEIDPTVIVRPSGIQVTVNIGTMAPVIGVSPDGIAVAATLGEIVATLLASPDGLLVAASLGTIDPDVEVTPDGIQVTTSLGNPTTTIGLVPDGILITVNFGTIVAGEEAVVVVRYDARSRTVFAGPTAGWSRTARLLAARVAAYGPEAGLASHAALVRAALASPGTERGLARGAFLPAARAVGPGPSASQEPTAAPVTTRTASCGVEAGWAVSSKVVAARAVHSGPEAGRLTHAD